MTDLGSAKKELTSRGLAMVDELSHLVGIESPSDDIAACAAACAAAAELGERLLGCAPETIEVEGHPHLRWRFGPDPAAGERRGVVLIGHLDTVWPRGTIDRWQFERDAAAGTATGPGCFDMKAGVVQMFHALSVSDDLDGVEIVLTTDEEVGSQTSRGLVEEAARRRTAALVLEPSAPGGVIKVGRKGTGMYTLVVEGRASHAGLEPEKGHNALIEASHLVLAVSTLGRPELGTTVTPTMSSAGTATNVVPAHATVEVDVRVAVPEEAGRVHADMLALATTVPGCRLEVRGGPNRPPMPTSSGPHLFDAARRIGADLGLGTLEGISVGGGSDGNFSAAVGCPTLDGLGAVGDGAHAEGEHIVLAALAERAALVTGLVDHIRG